MKLKMFLLAASLLCGCPSKPATKLSSAINPTSTASPAEQPSAAETEAFSTKTIEIEDVQMADAKLQPVKVDVATELPFLCVEQAFPAIDRVVVMATEERCSGDGERYLIDTTTGKMLAKFDKLLQSSEAAGYASIRRKTPSGGSASGILSLEDGSVHEQPRGQVATLAEGIPKILFSKLDRESGEVRWGAFDKPPEGDEIELPWKSEAVFRDRANLFPEAPDSAYFRTRDCYLKVPIAGGEAKCIAKIPTKMTNGRRVLYSHRYFLSWDAEEDAYEGFDLKTGDEVALRPPDCAFASGDNLNGTSPRVLFTCWDPKAKYVIPVANKLWTPDGILDVPGGGSRTNSWRDTVYELESKGVLGSSYRWLDLVTLQMYDGVDNIQRHTRWSATNERLLTSVPEREIYHVNAPQGVVRRVGRFDCGRSAGFVADDATAISTFCPTPKSSKPQEEHKCSSNALGGAVEQPYFYDVKAKKQYAPEHPVVAITDNAVVLSDAKFFTGGTKPCGQTQMWVAKR